MNYVKIIESQIEFHQGELVRLDTARKVLLEIERRNGKAVDAEPEQVKAASKTKEKVKRLQRKPRGSGKIVQDKILAVMTARAEPMRSGEIVVEFEKAGPVEKDEIYRNLTKLREIGTILIDDERRYSLSTGNGNAI